MAGQEAEKRSKIVLLRRNEASEREILGEWLLVGDTWVLGFEEAAGDGDSSGGQVQTSIHHELLKYSNIFPIKKM